MSSKTGGAVPSLGAGWGGPAHPAGPGEPPQLVALFVSVTVVISAVGWFLFWFLVQTRCGRRPLRRIERGARRGLNMTIIQSLPLHPYDPTRRSAEFMLLYRKRAAMMNVVDVPVAPQTTDGAPRPPTEASEDTIEVVLDAPSLSEQLSTEPSPAVLPVERAVVEEPHRSFAERVKTSFKFAGAFGRLKNPTTTTVTPLVTASNVSAKATQEPAVTHDPDTCVICLTTFEDGVNLRVLPCFHEFHPDCIDPWLLDLSARCPICKGNVAELLGCQPENDMGSEEVFYYTDLRELFMGPVVSLWRTVQSRA